MSRNYIIKALRDELEELELVRAPGGEGEAPVAWLAPTDGTPAPGEAAKSSERSDVVVGIYPAPGFALGAFTQQWLSREGVDVYIRVKSDNQPAAVNLARDIRRAVADRRGWDMGGMRIEQSLESRGVQLVTASEAQGATYVISFDFLVRDSEFGTE